MQRLPPPSHPAGDGRQTDAGSSSQLLLAWGMLLPGKAGPQSGVCAGDFHGVFFLIASV